MTGVMSEPTYKLKDFGPGAGRSAAGLYRALVYGGQPTSRILKAELLHLLFNGLSGAPGLWCRSRCFPGLFEQCGRKTVFGRNITLRHTHKIRLGQAVVLDDGSVLDAKGDGNRGITVGDGVYVGRNTIVYCKNGDIELGDRVNLSSNCQLFSAGALRIGAGTMVGAFCYFLNGGEYDIHSPVAFADQSGTLSKGPTVIGPNCWIGAHVTILDGVEIGAHCVIGAGAVVTQSLPPHTLALGIPARPVKAIDPGTGA